MRRNLGTIAFLVILLWVLFACAAPVETPAPVGSWPRRLGGTIADTAYAASRDGSGNIFIAGTVGLGADLDGDGSVTAGNPESAGSPYGGYDAFISKFNSSGAPLWSKRIGGAFSDNGFGIAADSSGNVIVTGSINGDADLDGNGTADGTPPETPGLIYAGDDIFVVKFNSAGTPQWSKRLGGLGNDSGTAVATDGSGNVYVTGYVSGNADLNGDGAVDASPFQETVDGAVFSGNDIFIVKFNSSGTAQWYKRLGGQGADTGYGIASDSSGNTALTGRIEGDADLDGSKAFNPGLPETATADFGGGDVFISAFNTSGGLSWMVRLGGTGDDEGRGIVIDSNGQAAATGLVNGPADLNGSGAAGAGLPETPGAAYGNDDVFISSFDSLGGFTWSERLGDAGNDRGFAIARDGSNNVYLTGFVTGDADLDDDDTVTAGLPETAGGVYSLEDGFIAVFNSAGVSQWAKRLGGVNNDRGQSVAPDGTGDAFVSGAAQIDADLDADANITAGLPETATGSAVYGGYDAFAGKVAGP